MTSVKFTILGEAASKANRRKHVTINNRPASIKSAKALSFEKNALMQIPPAARVQFDVPVRVTMWIYYTSQRPDLDESLILDVLQNRFSGKGDHRRLIQKGVYTNDRLVREKHIFHGIDKHNPRVEIEVAPLLPVQGGLL